MNCGICAFTEGIPLPARLTHKINYDTIPKDIYGRGVYTSRC